MVLKAGMEGRAEVIVSERDTAQAFGSGSLPVFATPRMVALMEEAACAAVQPALAEGETTVGVWIDVEHVAATPVGMTVTAEAVLEKVEGRTLHFAISAGDGKDTVGIGRHRRVVIDAARFMGKVEAKGG